ncbi:MAG: LCCL domain-containing protein [Deltaproteobacteria bacterium]|nr:LCCL domain-containing protein [Deltaproteobacteria bacterium]
MEDVPAAIDTALVALIGKPQRGVASNAPVAVSAPPPTSPPAAVNAPIAWTQNATQWRGQSGKLIVVDCPAGEGGNVYGGPIYTDDSSICASAVHAGFITRAGGRTTLQVSPGQPAYSSSLKNGINSAAWGAWQGSFIITNGMPLQTSPGPQAISWSTTATTWRGQLGRRIEVRCPPGGSAGSVYGGDPSYTDDSSICTAAVHAGRIGLGEGGVVLVEIAAGRPQFASTSANGITTRAWERSWDGAFLIR